MKKGEIVRLFNEDYIGAELRIIEVNNDKVLLKYINDSYPKYTIQTNIKNIYKI